MLKSLVGEEGCECALQVFLVRVDEKLLDERLHHGRHAKVRNGSSGFDTENQLRGAVTI